MLAIAGGKGGCGKTTTTLGLARALAERGYDPLVVDGDCDMPDVHHRLGLDRTAGIETIADGGTLADGIVTTAELPSVAILTGGRRDALESALRRVVRWEGPVLVDCGAGTSRDAVLPLRHADRAVVVSSDQPQCIEDAAVTRTIAKRLSTAVAGVVLRTTDSRNERGSIAPSQTSRWENSITPEWTVLGQLPQVDNPLTSPQVQHEFVAISKSIFDDSMGKSRKYTNLDTENADSTSDNRNHQRYCRRNI